MDKSSTIAELAKSLVSFQGEMEPVVFDAANPFFKSKYATLANLVSRAAPIATKYGLAVSQLTEGEGGVTTILMHISGEYLSSTLTLKAVKKMVKNDAGEKYLPEFPDPQSVGSAITYARRYAYASIIGLIAEADDDGNKASDLKATAEKSIEPVIKPQSSTLRETVDLMGQTKFGDLDKFQSWRVENNLPESLNGLTDFQLAKVMTKVREFKKAL